MTELYYRNIPKRVRVGCFWFRIEVAEFEDQEADGTFGHMNPINQKIRLRPGMTPQNLANTFIHEVLHAINWLSGAGVHTSESYNLTEEDFVTKTAHGLASFWQDNPKAVAWWARTLGIGSAAE